MGLLGIALDEMARRRFNVLTLWSLHPFPSLVRVPEYPDVALDDVWRSRVPLGPLPVDETGRHAVTPSMPGIWMSSSTQSGRSRTNAAMPSSPDAASRTR